MNTPNGHNSLPDFLGLGNETENIMDRNNAPLKSLRPSTLQSLSTLLNPIKIIPNDNGLLRDWRGLAELAGVTSEKIMFLESKEDPTSELIKIWTKEEGRSISDLKAFLSLIDRFDVCDDCSGMLENDIKHYWSLDEKTRNKVSLSSAERTPSIEHNVLTVDDTEEEATRYDAFILYAEEDSDFALQIVEKMEGEYNLKICVKDRDLLGGSMFEHEIIGRIIEERCNRLLAIFSPNFLKSQANQFLVSYAQALALELRQRKIIPCMYIRCELPPSVRYSFCLDYNRAGKLWNFWDRLSDSIRTVPKLNGVPVPEKKPGALTSQSYSLPAPSPQRPSTFQKKTSSPYDWWDSEKSEKPRQHSSHSDSGIQSDALQDFDTMSLQSGAPLLSSSVDQKSSGSKAKWFKKLMSPTKKKRKESVPQPQPS